MNSDERHQNLRQQLSIQLRYASAERHRSVITQQNSPPNNMRTHTNALAFAKLEPLDNLRHVSRSPSECGQHIHGPSGNIPQDAPTQQSVLPQHVACSTAHNNDLFSPSGGLEHREPSLFDLQSATGGSPNPQPSRVQSKASSAALPTKSAVNPPPGVSLARFTCTHSMMMLSTGSAQKLMQAMLCIAICCRTTPSTVPLHSTICCSETLAANLSARGHTRNQTSKILFVLRQS